MAILESVKALLGQCEIIQVYTNGIVLIQRGVTTECICIRRLSPYTAEED